MGAHSVSASYPSHESTHLSVNQRTQHKMAMVAQELTPLLRPTKSPECFDNLLGSDQSLSQFARYFIGSGIS